MNPGVIPVASQRGDCGLKDAFLLGRHQTFNVQLFILYTLRERAPKRTWLKSFEGRAEKLG
jgi:hypothetical protein